MSSRLDARRAQTDARDRRRGFFRTNRRLASTRQGKVFVAITLAVGVGVLNSGNNLLFLCLGLLLSIITVSGVLSEGNVRDVRLVVRAEPLAFAGARSLIELTLTNTHRRRDLYSLVVDLRFIAKSRFHAAPAPVHLLQPATLMHLPPGESRILRAEITFPVRGEWRLDEVRVETEYPFGLFKKTRVFLPALEVAVAPTPARDTPPVHLPPADDGSETQKRPGHAIELYDLQEASSGEDIRNIAWAKSAARGQLVSIRRARDATDAAVLALRGHAGEPAFERGLSQATALLITRMREGAPTGLLLAEATLAPAIGPTHEHAMLLLLARTEHGVGAATPRARLSMIVWLGAGVG